MLAEHLGQVPEAALEGRLTSAEHDQLDAEPVQVGHHIGDEVEALLLAHARHHRRQHGVIVDREAELGGQGVPAARLALGPLDRERGGQGRVGRRIPAAVVDAVDDADHSRHVPAQKAVEAMAGDGLLDLTRVARADRGHHVGVGQARLEERQLVPELGVVVIEHRPRQAQLRDHGAREQAAKRQVVDRGHHRHAGPGRIQPQQQRGQPGLPVVGVHQVEPTAEELGAVPDRGQAERREADVVVGVIGPAGRAVQAVAIVQGRGVEPADGQAIVVGAEQARAHHVLADHQGAIGAHHDRGHAGLVQRRRRGPVQRGQHRDLAGRIGRGLGPGQGRHHVGQPAGLRPRRDLAGDVQDAERAQAHDGSSTRSPAPGPRTSA